MTRPSFMSLGILMIVGLASALVAPCRRVAAQAFDSTGMPSLEQLAEDAGRASRRHPIRAVVSTILCDPASPVVDSASVAGCAALDATRAAAITAAFARGLEVPLDSTSDGAAESESLLCP